MIDSFTLINSEGREIVSNSPLRFTQIDLTVFPDARRLIVRNADGGIIIDAAI